MPNYADSFGYQWKRFAQTQLDSHTERYRISEDRIRSCTGWSPEEVRSRRILEVGCGAGRFTEVFTRWGARVLAVDLSEAVHVAARNVGQHQGASFAQADALALPVSQRFPFVFC